MSKRSKKKTEGLFCCCVIVNALFWLSGLLCYRGYKPASARQAPLWGGTLRPGLQHSKEKKDGPGGSAHSNLLAKSTFFSKLQTAA